MKIIFQALLVFSYDLYVFMGVSTMKDIENKICLLLRILSLTLLFLIQGRFLKFSVVVLTWNTRITKVIVDIFTSF